MLNREDPLVASARRQTPPPQRHHHVVRSTGCMSGIIQLLSKYQKKTKRLTCGRKQGKNNGSLSSPPKKEDVKKEPAALVVATRLMGLQEESPHNTKSTELKRRKILRALEKCNDDLESIRKIINSLKSVRQIGDIAMRPTPSPSSNQFTKAKHNGHITQQRKAGQRIKRLGEYVPVDKFTNNAPLFPVKPITSTSCSKAMIQSVEEVCNDTEWGQKREAEKIGLILQDHICRDLIEEFVKEMDLLCFRSLPFLACKKRLFF